MCNLLIPIYLHILIIYNNIIINTYILYCNNINIGLIILLPFLLFVLFVIFYITTEHCDN